MRKQRVHASPGLRRIERHRRLPILLQDGRVVVDDHRTVGIPVGPLANPQDGVIQAKGQQRHASNGE